MTKTIIGDALPILSTWVSIVMLWEKEVPGRCQLKRLRRLADDLPWRIEHL